MAAALLVGSARGRENLLSGNTFSGDASRGPGASRLFGWLSAAVVLVGVLAYDRDAYEPFGPPKWAILGVGLTLLAAFECLRGARSGEKVPAILLVGAFIPVSGAVAAWLAGWPGRSVEALMLEAGVALPAVFLAWGAGRHPAAARRWLDVFGVVGVVAALVGLAQVEPASGSRGAFDTWGFPSTPDFERFGVFAPVAAALHGALASLASPEAAARLSGPFSFIVGPLLEATGPLRPFALLPRNDGPASVFGHPNVAAECVTACFTATVVGACAHVAAARGPLRWPRRFLGAALRFSAGAVMAVYLVATGTRGPWVALFVVAACAVAIVVLRETPGRRLRIALAACGAGGVLLGAVLWVDASLPGTARGGGPREPLLTRVRLAFSGDDPRRDTVSERLVLWENSRAILRRPGTDVERMLGAMTGTGPATWALRYPEFQSAVARHAPGTYTLARRPDHAHQEALEWLVERGFLGAMLLTVVAAVAAARLYGTIRKGADDGAWTAAAVALAVVGLVVVSFFSFPFKAGGGVVLLALLVGLALSDVFQEGADAGTAAIFAGIAGAVFALLAKAPLALVPAAIAPWAVVGALDAWRSRRFGRAGVAALFGVVAPWGLAALWVDGRPVEAACAATAPIAGLLVAATAVGRVSIGPAAFRGLFFVALAFAAVVGLAAHARVKASRLHLSGVGWSRAVSGDPRVREEAIPKAVGALSESTLRDTTHGSASLERVQTLSVGGMFHEAEIEGRRACAMDPGSGNARVLCANLYFALGEDRRMDALAQARRAVAVVPDAPEPYLILGRILLQMRLEDRALTCFELAIERSPSGWQPFGKVAAAALLLARRTRPEDGVRAIAWLESAEAEASRDPVITSWIASLYEDPSLPPQFLTKATVLWERVAALDPLNADARLRRIVGYLAVDADAAMDVARLEDVVARISEWIPTLPDRLQVRARYFKALAERRLGRRDDAARGFADVVRLTALAPFRSATDAPFLNAALEEGRRLAEEAENKR